MKERQGGTCCQAAGAKEHEKKRGAGPQAEWASSSKGLHRCLPRSSGESCIITLFDFPLPQWGRRLPGFGSLYSGRIADGGQ